MQNFKTYLFHSYSFASGLIKHQYSFNRQALAGLLDYFCWTSIFFMIHKTTYFSKERESMLELVKKSTSSTDSRGEADEPKLRFFQFFL
jgi:hypothetical protein